MIFFSLRKFTSAEQQINPWKINADEVNLPMGLVTRWVEVEELFPFFL
jgi:hypothetical protein